MGTWVVTGANRGLGLEFARRLSERGQDVVATARDPEAAKDLRALPVRVARLDVTDGASVSALSRSMSGLAVDYLINNAGKGGRGPGIEALDWDLVRPFFEVNALGPLRVTQALLPNLRAGGTRTVVQISTRQASLADNESGGSYAYRASKAALNMFTRSLARDLEPEGFTCVLLHPGWVRTAIGSDRAPLSVEESVSGMLEVLDALSRSDNGRFLDRRGDEVPW